MNNSTFRIGIMLTTRCTLKCKHCSSAIPQHDSKDINKNIIFSSLEQIFRIFDSMEELGIYGGEALLHPDVDEIILEASKYRDKFSHIRLLTNGTIIPKISTLDIMKNLPCKIEVMVDDYGRHSTRLDQVLSSLHENEITVRLIHYNETEQYCGGWVDLGTDYSYKGYSSEDLDAVYYNCHSRKACLVCWGPALYQCAFAASGAILGRVPYVEGDWVDLLFSADIEAKREAAMRLGTRPVEACKYCNGFDPENSPRVPAAEQLQGVL